LPKQLLFFFSIPTLFSSAHLALAIAIAIAIAVDRSLPLIPPSSPSHAAADAAPLQRPSIVRPHQQTKQQKLIPKGGKNMDTVIATKMKKQKEEVVERIPILHSPLHHCQQFLLYRPLILPSASHQPAETAA
jgi:hypothetical protein